MNNSEKSGCGYRGARSCVKMLGGVPTLFINGKPFPAAAYMTYLFGRGHYSDFAEAGYRLFSLPVLFAGRWINSMTRDMKPFHKGVFDDRNDPDFSVFDENVRQILGCCPDAWIIPRINMSMPLWWIREHPDELDGTHERESFFSDIWLHDCAGLLTAFIEHINEATYAPHIAALQLADGNTEEWFHFDLNGGLSASSDISYKDYSEKEFPDARYPGLPDISSLKTVRYLHGDINLERYLRYSNKRVAGVISYLAGVAKQKTCGRTAIGVFYGYSLEVASPLWGTHALADVLKSEDVDFICSPCSYLGVRDPATDFTEMYPASSVRLHGKLCMQECDIRTHLTRPLGEAAPEYDPKNNMRGKIWHGLKDADTAVAQIRKAFGRQLVKGNGFWWFDMWGGWYDDPVLMGEIRRFREIYEESVNAQDRTSVAQLAVFIDETAYSKMTDCAFRNAICCQRKALGYMGAPYDIFDVSDFETAYQKYKAVIFITVLPSGHLDRVLSSCRKANIPYLVNSDLKTEFSSQELRLFCKKAGVHLYCETDDIVYVNKHCLVVHSADGGKKILRFTNTVSLVDLMEESSASPRNNVQTVYFKKGETRLFSIC